MNCLRRSTHRVLGPALLLAAGLMLPARPSSAEYPEITRIDGNVSVHGRCLMLRQHNGRILALRGETRGLIDGDHARLEGRYAPDPGCGAPGFEVAAVETLWADGHHDVVAFDERGGEPFLRYAERTGRFDLPDRGPDARYGAPGPDARYGAAGPGPGSPGPDRPDAYRDLPDRYGRYVYQGPHRDVTLVGTLHEAVGTCPTLETNKHIVVALDGDLGTYQAGDVVRVSGKLFDRDPNAPCGGPTVLLASIRGH